MSKEINFNVSDLQEAKLQKVIQDKLKLLCSQTGTGSIIIYVNDKIICDVIVSIKEKMK